MVWCFVWVKELLKYLKMYDCPETKWFKSDVIKLINLYKKRECLWNINSSLYKRIDLRKKAIEELSQVFRVPGDAIKKKLKYLRTAYNAEKKKIAESYKSGEEIYVPILFYFNEFTFLDDSIIIKRKTNVSKLFLEELFQRVMALQEINYYYKHIYKKDFNLFQMLNVLFLKLHNEPCQYQNNKLLKYLINRFLWHL